MNKATTQEIHRLGGEPDGIWAWLLERGPHGPHFTWGQTRESPSGYVGIEHLERVVAEFAQADPGFIGQCRAIVALALQSLETDFLRRAIQVAAVVGGDAEGASIRQLAKHPSPTVAADARAAAFYRKQRQRGEGCRLSSNP